MHYIPNTLKIQWDTSVVELDIYLVLKIGYWIVMVTRPTCPIIEINTMSWVWGTHYATNKGITSYVTFSMRISAPHHSLWDWLMMCIVHVLNVMVYRSILPITIVAILCLLATVSAFTVLWNCTVNVMFLCLCYCLYFRVVYLDTCGATSI